ncbi:hypothetical protein C8J57DRAFT_1346135 [Mycena rebaudengoi]|nr:hypothetical protein C8J57DRAFT_1346135 [Mycena rebaudengoi]
MNFSRPTASKVPLGGGTHVRGPYGRKRQRSHRERCPMAKPAAPSCDDDDADPVLFCSISPTCNEDAPVPGSAGWNAEKRVLLEQARLWTERVNVKKGSGDLAANKRHSVPLPAKSAVTAASRKRHSAPAILSPNAWRLSLADQFESLALEAQETMAALNVEQFQCNDDSAGPVLPTIVSETPRTPGPPSTVAPTSGRLISSISASGSLDALANASSRSLSNLLASYDTLMAGAQWRRVSARYDAIMAVSAV